MTLRLMLAAVVWCLPACALAVVVEQQVTPDFIEEHPGGFSVKTKQLDGGSVQFTIERTLPRPMYLVARLQVCQQGRLLVEFHHPSYALEPRETYAFTVSSEHVAESVFELSESPFSENEGKTPLPGGTYWVLRLKDFVPAPI